MKTTRESPCSSNVADPSKAQFMRKKEFQIRESPFTLVLENSPEAKAIYCIAASQLFLFILYTVVRYFVDPRVYYADAQFLSSQLSGIGAFFDSWVKIHAVTILAIYPFTKLWMLHQCRYTALYALALVPPFLYILIHPVYTLLENKFLYLLAFSMTVEQVRILMKNISFIVENHRKVMRALKSASALNNNSTNSGNQDSSDNCDDNFNNLTNETKSVKSNDESEQLTSLGASKSRINYHVPHLNQLIYFLFAPTLIYRDEYPRSTNTQIRWYKAASLFTEFFVYCFMALQITNRVGLPKLMKQCTGPMSHSDIVENYILTTLLAVLCTFGLGYGFLHCWLNAWAEILRFGDREFYKTWWTSLNFAQFWRRWNGVVQPWIYEYLYKPMVHFTGGNRVVATLTVFVVSAVVHEHITGFALGAILPMFGLAMLAFCPFIVAFSFLHQMSEFYSGVFVYSVNWIIWSTTLYGYALENACRLNCPAPANATFFDQIKPRILSCAHLE